MSILKRELTVPGAERIWYVADAFRAGMTVEEIFGMTMIDRGSWCRSKI
jgi:carbamoyl-phosphate synthase large subunit